MTSYLPLRFLCFCAYKTATDFCLLILYPSTSLNDFIICFTFVTTFLGILFSGYIVFQIYDLSLSIIFGNFSKFQ